MGVSRLTEVISSVGCAPFGLAAAGGVQLDGFLFDNPAGLSFRIGIIARIEQRWPPYATDSVRTFAWQLLPDRGQLMDACDRE
jgi:hypothetical protein